MGGDRFGGVRHSDLNFSSMEEEVRTTPWLSRLLLRALHETTNLLGMGTPSLSAFSSVPLLSPTPLLSLSMLGITPGSAFSGFGQTSFVPGTWAEGGTDGHGRKKEARGMGRQHRQTLPSSDLPLPTPPSLLREAELASHPFLPPFPTLLFCLYHRLFVTFFPFSHIVGRLLAERQKICL